MCYKTCMIRLRTKFRKISIMNVHGLAKDKDTEEKEQFYEEEILTRNWAKKKYINHILTNTTYIKKVTKTKEN